MFRLVALIVLLAVPSLAQAESALEMRSGCELVANSRSVDGKIDVPQEFDAGVCWGAFASIQKVINIVSTKDPTNQPFFRVYAPSKSTRAQLIAVFVEYLHRNPDRLHEDYFFVALDALRKAFPCK